MKLHIKWRRPLRLVSGRSKGLTYLVNLDRIPNSPGIYIFARRYSKSYEALYVGKTTNLRRRVRQQLHKNVRLMNHVLHAKTGTRWVMVGEIATKPGQQKGKALDIIERAYIRHFLAEGHDLVNQQGTKIRTHELVSTGRVRRRFIPSMMNVEK